MRKLMVGSMIVVTAIAVGVTFASASDRETSQVDGPSLEVSSLTGHPGDDLTVGGSGCDYSARVWLTPAPGTVDWDPAFAEPVALVTPADDGDWQVTVTVPEFRTDYRLEVGCFDEAVPPDGFLYAHERYVAE
jgi:hypothetical protein